MPHVTATDPGFYNDISAWSKNTGHELLDKSSQAGCFEASIRKKEGQSSCRLNEKVKVKKNMVSKMFGAMMPRGSKKLALSKMNMGDIGAKMIRSVMKKQNVDSLEDLIQQVSSLRRARSWVLLRKSCLIVLKLVVKWCCKHT